MAVQDEVSGEKSLEREGGLRFYVELLERCQRDDKEMKAYSMTDDCIIASR